ncbi:type II toxin-antitoxin system mRNA interferase toxin, RelE/StbE family [Candidatus Woesearchaeota archaeon CG11_big_fil_rev_8_21_14_0_20_43_8]|nr:MAG: type II toxin-antitoxin system mRNA interferase toxin, RelE/StbE family [Candidatus Woesearchaeota archaeon CG11_big_fil_rev_8_21_14_0_20_43_8]PIO08913.1 MAG: type II toxin-antitoxin system mRNA interferase toxin, RelE/StbE family [Candidatus Woesearchaeota archaeon CG08_land_8_20_14_0_20_43_7]
MIYSVEVTEEVNKTFLKLAKKNKKQMDIVKKKVKQIQKNPLHFKPLRGDMYGTRRVHINKSFVLTYDVDECAKVVRILDFDHQCNL